MYNVVDGECMETIGSQYINFKGQVVQDQAAVVRNTTLCCWYKDMVHQLLASLRFGSQNVVQMSYKKAWARSAC